MSSRLAKLSNIAHLDTMNPRRQGQIAFVRELVGMAK